MPAFIRFITWLTPQTLILRGGDTSLSPPTNNPYFPPQTLTKCRSTDFSCKDAVYDYIQDNVLKTAMCMRNHSWFQSPVRKELVQFNLNLMNTEDHIRSGIELYRQNKFFSIQDPNSFSQALSNFATYLKDKNPALKKYTIPDIREGITYYFEHKYYDILDLHPYFIEFHS